MTGSASAWTRGLPSEPLDRRAEDSLGSAIDPEPVDAIRRKPTRLAADVDTLVEADQVGRAVLGQASALHHGLEAEALPSDALDTLLEGCARVRDVVLAQLAALDDASLDLPRT